MTFDFHAGIALLQLIVYVPSAFLAVFLMFRHGLARSAGWYFLTIFCLTRIAGSIAHMISLSSYTRGVVTAEIICGSIGLSPLILLFVGLLSRVNDHLSEGRLNNYTFKVVEWFSFLGLILGVVGGAIASTNSSGSSYGTSPLNKVSIIMFVLVFLATLVFLAILAGKKQFVAVGEKRILALVAASAPFLAVRFSYSLIFIFTSKLRFSSTFGDAGLYLGMAVIEEIVVVLAALAVGLSLSVLPKRAKDVESSQANQVKNEHSYNVVANSEPGVQDRQPKQKEAFKFRGPISMLVHYIKEKNAKN